MRINWNLINKMAINPDICLANGSAGLHYFYGGFCVHCGMEQPIQDIVEVNSVKKVECSKCGYSIEYVLSNNPKSKEESLHQTCPRCKFEYTIMFVHDNLPESTANYSRRYS